MGLVKTRQEGLRYVPYILGRQPPKLIFPRHTVTRSRILRNDIISRTSPAALVNYQPQTCY